MADGVVMFDEKLRLAAWNLTFEELLDLPDLFFGEPRIYADYIRYLAERGEFGSGADPEAEPRRYTENAGRHYSFERARPDGRVLEIRHNPVPDGGFVLIYSDITERKQSQAEIGLPGTTPKQPIATSRLLKRALCKRRRWPHWAS